jgi:hypothetical protein
LFHVTITMSHNSGLSHAFEWVDSNGAPISLAGRTLKAQIKRNLTDTASVLELSTDNGWIIIHEDEPNRFTLKIPANRLQPTPQVEEGAEADEPYHFDLLDMASPDERPLLMRGEIHVVRGVTQ